MSGAPRWYQPVARRALAQDDRRAHPGRCHPRPTRTQCLSHRVEGRIDAKIQCHGRKRTQSKVIVSPARRNAPTGGHFGLEHDNFRWNGQEMGELPASPHKWHKDPTRPEHGGLRCSTRLLLVFPKAEREGGSFSYVAARSTQPRNAAALRRIGSASSRFATVPGRSNVPLLNASHSPLQCPTVIVSPTRITGGFTTLPSAASRIRLCHPRFNSCRLSFTASPTLKHSK